MDELQKLLALSAQLDEIRARAEEIRDAAEAVLKRVKPAQGNVEPAIKGYASERARQVAEEAGDKRPVQNALVSVLANEIELGAHE